MSVRLLSSRSPVAADRLALSILVAAVLAVTTLPYVFAYSIARADKQFMGILLNVPDTAQYLSWAQASAHAVFIENKLTPEQGAAVFFNPFWFLIGRLSDWLSLGPAETLQLVRPVTGALYLAGTYWLVSLVARDRLERWTTFLVAALGSGLGWTLVVAKQVTGELGFPLDLYTTEPNTFLTVMAFPFAAIAGGMLVIILGVAACAFVRGNVPAGLAAGILALILGLQHGYDLLIVYAVVGVTALILAARSTDRIRPLIVGFAVCAPSGPAALYLVYLTRESPIWRGVLAQYGNAGVYTPSPPHLLILMGLPLLLALVGLLSDRPWRAWRTTAVPDLLVWVWLIVGFALLYIPTDYQIKMLGGWQVPVAIVGVRTLLRDVTPRLARRWKKPADRLGLALAALLVAAVLPTNMYLYAWRFTDLARQEYPYYLERDDVAAMRWLRANTEPSDVVLSSLTIGQYVPNQAGNTAFLAHWAQTLDFYGKRRTVARFFDARTSEQDRAEIIRSFDVRYVFIGEPEQALGAFEPDSSPHLTRVFTAGRTSIYAVTTPAKSPEGR